MTSTPAADESAPNGWQALEREPFAFAKDPPATMESSLRISDGNRLEDWIVVVRIMHKSIFGKD